MAKYKVGTKVAWDSEAGHVSGTIKKIHTKPFKLYGKDGTAYTRHASKDDPVYEIKSNKSDHIAYHYGKALHKAENGIAITPEQQYLGLNDPNYTGMYFPNTGINTFRGLDNGQPVQLIDQTGKSAILTGPNDQIKMKGNVMEHKLKFGGSVDITPIIDNFPEAKSGIKIKKSHQGKFTAWAKKHGMSVQEAASHVMANKDKYSASVVKMANFAKNSKGWNHGENGLPIDPKLYDYDYQKAATIQPINYTPQVSVPQMNINVPTYIDPTVAAPDTTINQNYSPVNPLDTAAVFLSAADHILPGDQYRPLNPLQIEYSQHPNGTGSQAIYQKGGTLSDDQLYTNYYDQFKSQNQKDPGRLANIMVLSHKYNVAPSKIMTTGYHPTNGSQLQYRDYQVFGNDGKLITSLRENIGGTQVGSDQGGVQAIGNTPPIDSKKLAKNDVASLFDNGGNMGSPVSFKWGGGAKVISNNPYTNSPTIEFTGKSHKEGGIGLQYGSNTAEVEGKETAYIGKDGDMNIMGNMTVPGTSMKFKNAMKKISNKENKANKQSSIGQQILDRYMMDTSKFGDIGTTSGELMQLGAQMRLQQLDSQKNYLSNLQNAMLETADEFGIDPQAMSNGKVKKAKKGMKMKAQMGARIQPIFNYNSGVANPVTPTPVSQSNYYFGDSVPQQFQPIIREAADKYDISPAVLARMISAESSFNPKAVSGKGNKGLMQLSSAVAKKYGVSDVLNSTDPTDIAKVVDAGAHYLADLKSQNGGDIGLALAAYNGGQKAIESAKKALGKQNISHFDLLDYWEKRRENNPTKTPSAWQNETYDYLNKILRQSDQDFYGKGSNEFYNTYYNPAPTEPTPNISVPPPGEQFTPNVPNNDNPNTPGLTPPNPATPGTPSYNIPYTPITPKEYEPTNLPISQIAPELLAFATNNSSGAQGEAYIPRLYQPYQISLQDQLNENQSTFRGLEQLTPNNPEYLSTLAAKKYQANEQVLGNEFRTNQQIDNDIANKNIELLNRANMINLQLGDQQYVRNEQAKSNTKAANNAILNSIASKLAQNSLINKEMNAYSQMFPYYQIDNSTGNVEYVGPQEIPLPITNTSGITNYTPTQSDKKSSNGSIVKIYKNK